MLTSALKAHRSFILDRSDKATDTAVLDALLNHRRPIVIFDEATANVDPENEDQLQRAMEALTREKTVLMIAHRLKTVRGADQILVLDQGSVVQKGTHDELIQQAGIYRDFVSERTESSRWTL